MVTYHFVIDLCSFLVDRLFIYLYLLAMVSIVTIRAKVSVATAVIFFKPVDIIYLHHQCQTEFTNQDLMPVTNFLCSYFVIDSEFGFVFTVSLDLLAHSPFAFADLYQVTIFDHFQVFPY